MIHWIPEMKMYTFRLVAASFAFVFRLLLGWYSGIDFLAPNPHTANYILWTGIFSVLVYLIILPRRRTQERHPNQRITDRG
jgi:hypothetical protein